MKAPLKRLTVALALTASVAAPALAQSTRIEALANLPFEEGRPTPETAASPREENGPPAMIGAFDFAYVGFAVIWGLVFFSEVPDVTSTFGMLLIVGAGVLALRQ